MKLSEDLVREFAEVTNDAKKDENPEPTCYGTASFQGEQGYVQIDGSDFLTPATFTVGAEQGDRVLVVIKGRKALVIGNITNPVLLVGTLKAANGIVVNGWLTTNEKRTAYNDWTKAGLTFSNGGIGAYGGANKYWYLTNNGELFANSATITGDITATSLTLSGNTKIPSGKVDGLAAVATSGDAYDILNLKPIATSGLAKDVGGLAPIATDGKWSSLINNPMLVYLDSQGVLTSGQYGEGTVGFVISKDGLLQASNAIIYGTIFASAGKIGGLALDSKSIHTLDVAITSNANSSIGLSSENFTRTVAGASRTGLRLAIGSGFGVDYTGKLYASGAVIRGDIEATSLNLTAAATTALNNTIDSRIPAGPDLTVYIKKDGTLGTISESSSAGFLVSSAGLLKASNATIYGTIFASAGKIGGLAIDSNSIHTLNVAVTSNVAASIALSSVDFKRTVAGAERSGLRLAIGPRFGVTSGGVLYASDAEITGAITATSLTLGTNASVAAGKVTGLAAVATTGNYNSLSNRPTIPDVSKINAYFDSNGVLCKGSTPSATAKGFLVDLNGLLQASNAIIWGTIYASEGNIGGLTLKNNVLYTNNHTAWDTNVDGVYIGADHISLGKQGVFNVDNAGKLTATNAVIKGAITATSLTLEGNAATTLNNTIDGRMPNLTVYIKKDGTLGTVADGSTGFVVSSAGKLEAANAVIWGEIHASAGNIGGLTLQNNNLYTNSHTSLTASNDGVFIGAAGISLGSGGKFRVTNAGALTATSADIEGKIKSTDAEIEGKVTAKSGKIGAFTLTSTGMLYSSTHSAWNSNVDGVYIGSDYISLGSGGKFYIKANGTAYCNGAAFNIVYPNAISTYTEVTALNFYLGGTASTNMVGKIYGKVGSQAGLHISSPYWGIIWIDGDLFCDGLYPTTLIADTSISAAEIYSTTSMYTYGNFAAGETNIDAGRVVRAKNSHSSVCIYAQNSSSGTHGLYSDTASRWMLWRTASSGTINMYTSLHIDKATYDGNLTATNGNGSTTSPANVTVGGVSNVLSFSYKNQLGKTKTVIPIRAFGDNEDGTNNGIVLLGSNTGATIITSGEEAPYLIRTKGISNNENTYVIADGSFVVYTGASHTSATTDSITTITGTAKEAMNIGTNGYVQVLNYANYLRVAITSASDDGKRVSAVRCDSSTSFSVHGQWGTTGSTYSYKTITTSASDIRLKENIVFSNAKSLALINRIPLYEFDWKDGRHWDVGFVADYIVNVDPRLAIIRKSDDEYSSIDTYYMTGHIVKAIQELSILHNDHEDRITALEKENRYLKEQLKQLTAA